MVAATLTTPARADTRKCCWPNSAGESTDAISVESDSSLLLDAIEQSQNALCRVFCLENPAIQIYFD